MRKKPDKTTVTSKTRPFHAWARHEPEFWPDTAGQHMYSCTRMYEEPRSSLSDSSPIIAWPCQELTHWLLFTWLVMRLKKMPSKKLWALFLMLKMILRKAMAITNISSLIRCAFGNIFFVAIKFTFFLESYCYKSVITFWQLTLLGL